MLIEDVSEVSDRVLVLVIVIELLSVIELDDVLLPVVDERMLVDDIVVELVSVVLDCDEVLLSVVVVLLVKLMVLVHVVEVRVEVLVTLDVLDALVLVSVKVDVSEDVVSVAVVVVVVQTGVSSCAATRLYGAGQPVSKSHASLNGSTTPTVISTPFVSTGRTTTATVSDVVCTQERCTVYLPGSQQEVAGKLSTTGTTARTRPTRTPSLSAKYTRYSEIGLSSMIPSI